MKNALQSCYGGWRVPDLQTAGWAEPWWGGGGGVTGMLGLGWGETESGGDAA